MKIMINKLAKLAGISVRTLHYYDEIKLLIPPIISEAGYRYYDENSIKRLQQIMFYRELDFSLDDIKKILSSPNYNREKALKNQKSLLILKKEKIENLINLINKNLKEDDNMSFKEFDDSKICEVKEKYRKETIEKYGNTKAFAESEAKMANYDDKKYDELNKQADDIFKRFSDIIDLPCESGEAQSLVGEWQRFITENYYNCTDDIFAGLADLYISDSRFAENMDKFKKGTSEYIGKAIKVFCKNNNQQ